jgi:hypothetical protein
MPCELLKPLTEKPDLAAELTFQLDRLRLIDADENFIKGFQYCREFVDEYLNTEK